MPSARAKFVERVSERVSLSRSRADFILEILDDAIAVIDALQREGVDFGAEYNPGSEYLEGGTRDDLKEARALLRLSIYRSRPMSSAPCVCSDACDGVRGSASCIADTP